MIAQQNILDLVAMIKQGNQIAESKFVKKYERIIFAIAFHYVSNKEDAEEITYDTLTICISNIKNDKLREPEKIYLERLNLEYLNSSEDYRRYLNVTIDELNFSTRTNNALKHMGVEYVGQLINFDESYLLKFRNIGKVSIKELQNKLAENGLRLGMDVQFTPLTKI